MAETRTLPLKLKSWQEYIKADATKDEKLSALMRNKNLLFADAEEFRAPFWKSMLPKAVEYKFIEEYQKSLDDYDTIVHIV